ncbi:unnamed protein product [Caenorhabditis bovis]|uniref:Uncharacterized protein n=1 Tax=Caenorhabditis bovis TaxID=2654633 RepID=A0A8S1ER62_9PELO|nr:unnamed protein product [Caenorhabditis bovis]
MPNSNESKGFREWYSKHANQPSSSVLYSSELQEHKRKREEAVARVSLKNPTPTKSDYDAFDADRRLREKARDLRVSQRIQSPAKENTYKRVIVKSPEVTSPTLDQYFTPMKFSDEAMSSNDASFVTPATSYIDRNRTETTMIETPTSRNLNGTTNLSRFDRTRLFQTSLDERMKKNFEQMMKTFHEAAPDVDQENRRYSNSFDDGLEKMDSGSEKLSILSPTRDSPRRHQHHIPGQIEHISPIRDQRSIEFAAAPPPPPPPPPPQKEASDLTYVQTTICASQMQRMYAERADQMEQHLAKVVQLTTGIEARSMTRLNGGAEESRELKETLVDELRNKIKQIIYIKKLTHELVSKRAYVIESQDIKRSEFLDVLLELPMREMEKEVCKERKLLSKELNELIAHFRQVGEWRKERNRRRQMRAQNRMKPSEAIKIKPAEKTRSVEVEAKEAPKETHDVETQVSARFEPEPTVTTPRKAGVEPLDLTKLNSTKGDDGTIRTSVELNRMLDSIVLKTDKSLEDVMNKNCAEPDGFEDESILDKSHLSLNSSKNSTRRFEAVFPSRPSTGNNDETPKSARASLDSSSGRKLSIGIANYLEMSREEELDEPTNEPQPPPQPQDAVVEQKAEPLNEPDVVEEKPEPEEAASAADTSLELVWKQPEPLPEFVEEDEEEDETKKFRVPDEFEDPMTTSSSSSEPHDDAADVKVSRSDENASFNDSADDSGFLLTDKPIPKLKSIIDADTPRAAPPAKTQENDDDDDDDVGFDLETYCRNDYLTVMTPKIIDEALKNCERLRGRNWLTASEIWPPTFMTIVGVMPDEFEYFDSFNVCLWGSLVELLNSKFLKYHEVMTNELKEQFRAMAKEMLCRDFGPMSRTVEWHQEIRTNQRVENLMLYDVDYRFEQRRQLPDTAKQNYRWAQLSMMGITERYTSEKLDAQLSAICEREMENVASKTLENEVRRVIQAESIEA